jgi:chemotaxis protein methyltransferase CheR
MTMLAGTSACPFEGANDLIFSRADFAAIAQIVYGESGNIFTDGKAMLVYSRLTRRLRACQLHRFADYINLIETDEQERRIAVNLLTTNHTYFFREGHHYTHFVDHVRPGLIAAASAGNPVRIWSAGCSSGEEVYSLAMALLGEDRGEGQRIAGKDIVFLASDLADHAIDAAKAASYAVSALEPVPPLLRRHWTTQNGAEASMAAVVQQLVRFRRLNLLHQWPFQGLFDAIFCRNVMIYFDEPTKERLLDRFAEQLAPGGYLYIGHSERLSGPAERWLIPVGKTIYRKVE